MEGGVFGKILDSKVVDADLKGFFAVVVASEAGGIYNGLVAVRG